MFHLSTCWIAAFKVEAARTVLRLPVDAEPFIFTPLGYPANCFLPYFAVILCTLPRERGDAMGIATEMSYKKTGFPEGGR